MADFLNPPALRRVTQTKELHFHSSTVFNAVADISSYHTFLPFVISSTVTSKDTLSLPKTARLTIGSPALALEEEWHCTGRCDQAAGTVEARKQGKAGDGSVLEHWSMKWKLHPAPAPGVAAKKTASVTLEMEVQFRSIMYDQMFALLQDQVVGKMMSKFEPKIVALDEAERKERVRKIKVEAQVEAAKKKAEAEKTSKSAAKTAPKKLEIRSGSKQPAGAKATQGSAT
jgi:ribosome-associated toxin RatA of RatAB toxin-antitoxin module